MSLEPDFEGTQSGLLETWESQRESYQRVWETIKEPCEQRAIDSFFFIIWESFLSECSPRLMDCYRGPNGYFFFDDWKLEVDRKVGSYKKKRPNTSNKGRLFGLSPLYFLWLTINYQLKLWEQERRASEHLGKGGVGAPPENYDLKWFMKVLGIQNETFQASVV